MRHLFYLPILCFSLALSQDATASRDEHAYTFTNCGQTGATGPSQSQCNSVYLSSNLNGLVTVSGGIQEWVVPLSGFYFIEFTAQSLNETQKGCY